MSEDLGLLLAGHGSRSRESEGEMRAVAERVTGALRSSGTEGRLAVELGYLEMSEPPAGVVLDKMVADGCRRIVVLPLMLLAAGHGKSDVPAVVVEGRQRHPDVDITFGSPLGVARELVSTLGDQIAAAGAQELPLLVVARGTSDPDANAEAHKAGRLLAEWSAAPFVHTAFTGVTWPLVPEGLETMARLGHRKIGLAFWFLCDGKLVQRARAQAAEFSQRTGIEVVDAGYLAGPGEPDDRVLEVILERYRMALAGDAPVYSCDTCAYRAPFPGLEDRVGQPVGVGHSHLAEEHRHHDHGHGHHHPDHGPIYEHGEQP